MTCQLAILFSVLIQVAQKSNPMVYLISQNALEHWLQEEQAELQGKRLG